MPATEIVRIFDGKELITPTNRIALSCPESYVPGTDCEDIDEDNPCFPTPAALTASLSCPDATCFLNVDTFCGWLSTPPGGSVVCIQTQSDACKWVFEGPEVVCPHNPNLAVKTVYIITASGIFLPPFVDEPLVAMTYDLIHPYHFRLTAGGACAVCGNFGLTGSLGLSLEEFNTGCWNWEDVPIGSPPGRTLTITAGP